MSLVQRIEKRLRSAEIQLDRAAITSQVRAKLIGKIEAYNEMLIFIEEEEREPTELAE